MPVGPPPPSPAVRRGDAGGGDRSGADRRAGVGKEENRTDEDGV